MVRETEARWNDISRPKLRRPFHASKAILQLSCRDLPPPMRALNSSENHPSTQQEWAQPSLEKLPCLSRGAGSWAGAQQNPALLGKNPCQPPRIIPWLCLTSCPACPFTAHVLPGCCGDGAPVGAATTAVLGSCKSGGCHRGKGQSGGHRHPTSSGLLGEPSATTCRCLARLGRVAATFSLLWSIQL